MEEYNLKDEIRRLKEKVDGVEVSKDKKKFRLPTKGRLSKQNLKKGYVTVLHIKNNRHGEFIKLPIDESTTMLNGIPRIAKADDIILIDDKGKTVPMIIQPEWRVNPINPSEDYEKAVNDEMTSEGYSLLMNRMQKEVIALKKKMGTWMIFLIIGIIVVAAFFLLGGGKLFGLK